MLHRFLTTLAVAGICFCASPAVPLASTAILVEPDLKFDAEPLPDNGEFAEAARADPLRMLGLAAKRYLLTASEGDKEVVSGYSATFHKRERIRDVLQPQEVIRVNYREQPFAVQMHWERGGGLADRTLYVAGEHGGKMLARSRRLGIVLEADPRGSTARNSARYTIEEFGMFHSTKRALKVWTGAESRGSLEWKFLGTRTVPATGDRECHVLRRLCAVDELDAFASGEANPRIGDDNRADSFRTITLYFDTRTWLQLGAELHRADGELAGSYFYRDVMLNPAFPDGAFTRAALKK